MTDVESRLRNALGTLGPRQRKQLVGYLREIRRNLEPASAADRPGKRLAV
jgi:hypothetical protein